MIKLFKLHCTVEEVTCLKSLFTGYKRSIKVQNQLHLTWSMSSASVLSSTSRNTSVRVFQLTGCFPLPAIHSWRIFELICSALHLCSCSSASNRAPVLSSRSRIPKSLYLMLISWGMLNFLSRPWNLIHSFSVG